MKKKKVKEILIRWKDKEFGSPWSEWHNARIWLNYKKVIKEKIMMGCIVEVKKEKKVFYVKN